MQNPRSRDTEHDTGIARCNRLWLVVQVWRKQAMPVRTAAASIKAQKTCHEALLTAALGPTKITGVVVAS